ncbi:response regulator receiver domain protein [delta proteobacterium NaphS2]|nr:response regulator receiver domain protein [delta proteobacterium NaphS2]
MSVDDPKTVLMADDDEDDCFLAREAFEACGTGDVFSCVEDGMKLMEYLSACARPGPQRLPHVILLDLNMPRKDGREVLLEIKANPGLRNIPIAILTTSREEKDVSFAMKASAKLFITKPSTFDQWVEIMKSITTLGS